MDKLSHYLKIGDAFTGVDPAIAACSLAEVHNNIRQVEVWTVDNVRVAMEKAAQSQNEKFGTICKFIRTALCAQLNTDWLPSIDHTLYLLQKERSLFVLKTAVKAIAVRKGRDAMDQGRRVVELTLNI